MSNEERATMGEPVSYSRSSIRDPRSKLQLLPRIALAVAAALIASSASADLQWRSGRSALETARPKTVDQHVQLASGTESRPHYRSVIIGRPDAPGTIRSAQLDELNDAPIPDDLPALDPNAPDSFDLDMPPQPQDNDAPQLERNQLPPPNGQGPIEGSPGQPAPLDTTMQPGALPDGIPTPSVDTMEAERKKSEEACDQGLEDLNEKTISTLSLDIAVTGDEGSDFPFECSLDDSGWHEGRCWEETTYMWKASALCHKPLFFEDEQLERYGHSFTPCCQPLVSACHFFTRLPVLPYCMGVEPPNECIYALGHYRPGSCAPYMCNPVPLSCRGAMFQAGAVTGAVFVLP